MKEGYSMISAETVSLQGDKYLGTPYSRMDCQGFVERCLADAGLKKDLAGSNAWYREVRRNGWVGTPEECRARFGRIPTGAFLFILKQDGGEAARGYKDELGNASHIGLYTGRGQGAIHSSSSRGCVAESTFAGKTIRTGGWNTVGLWKELDYGNDINVQLGHREEAKQMAAMIQTTLTGAATVSSTNGKPVRVRAKPTTKSSIVTTLPIGTAVEVVETDGDWCRIAYAQTGWMMKQYLSEGLG